MLGNKKICTHFGRNDHTINTCYRKHSFPPHFDKNPIVAYQSFLESSEVMEDVDDSKVADVMTTMDSLRNNMVNMCIYFMHQVQIQFIMLPLAK